VFGTLNHVASAMGEVMAEVGGDGFMISAPVSRRYIAEMTDGLVPALQAQGLVRSAYPTKDFRDALFEF
jgi:long-chain alkane monooxygenase